MDRPDKSQDSQENQSSPEAPAISLDPAPDAPDISAPTPLADGVEHHVDPRTVKIGRIVGFAVILPISLLPFAFTTVGWALGGIPGPVYFPLLGVWLTLVSIALTVAFKLPAARHNRLRYLVHEDGLRIRRGVFWHKVIWIPITRVQHTDFSQGPIQRKFGLATMTVHTAGTAGASISLPGLEFEMASRLCDHLRPVRVDHGD